MVASFLDLFIISRLWGEGQFPLVAYVGFFRGWIIIGTHCLIGGRDESVNHNSYWYNVRAIFLNLLSESSTMSHYYSENPNVPLKTKTIEVFIRGQYFKFITASGVFSFGKYDEGTRLLVENAILEKDWRVLDLGCGYGAIGIVVAKFVDYVVMTDINRRAISIAKKNLKINNVKNAEVRWGNLYEPVKGEKFHSIITNPPVHAGKEVLREIVINAPKHLYDGGLLQLVIRTNQGAKFIKALMEQTFKDVRELAKGSGYRVYAGIA